MTPPPDQLLRVFSLNDLLSPKEEFNVKESSFVWSQRLCNIPFITVEPLILLKTSWHNT